MRYITKVIVYQGESAMSSGNHQMQANGWEIVNVSVTSGGWGCLNTVLLAIIFLPLALLGKNSDNYTVTYRIPENEYTPEVLVTEEATSPSSDNTRRNQQMAMILGISFLLLFIYILFF